MLSGRVNWFLADITDAGCAASEIESPLSSRIGSKADLRKTHAKREAPPSAKVLDYGIGTQTPC
jgi:hypothetical protein